MTASTFNQEEDHFLSLSQICLTGHLNDCTNFAGNLWPRAKCAFRLSFWVTTSPKSSNVALKSISRMWSCTFHIILEFFLWYASEESFVFAILKQNHDQTLRFLESWPKCAETPRSSGQWRLRDRQEWVSQPRWLSCVRWWLSAAMWAESVLMLSHRRHGWILMQRSMEGMTVLARWVCGKFRGKFVKKSCQNCRPILHK